MMTEKADPEAYKVELKLSHYTLANSSSEDGEKLDSKYLDWKTYPETLLHLLRTKYFFRRFSIDQLKKHLRSARLRVYKKDDIVFISRSVAVILSGAILIKNHPMDDLSNPKLLSKAQEGDVIGFDEGDTGITADPLTWMVTFSDNTEVLIFTREEFKDLWNLQKGDIER